MRKFICLLPLLVVACFNPNAEEKTIRQLLGDQETAWNNGNIEQFMEGYWKSDSLKFIGKEITRGWNATLKRYKTTYPNRDKMGQLKFTFYEFRFVANDACVVTGRYQLKRTEDEPTGMFTLLLRKMNGKWVIVYDHTS